MNKLLEAIAEAIRKDSDIILIPATMISFAVTICLVTMALSLV